MPGKSEHVACHDFVRRASALGMHDRQGWGSKETACLSRGQTQALSGVKKGELAGQRLDLGQVAVFGGIGIGVIEKLYVPSLARNASAPAGYPACRL